jgi:Capsid protein (F protein).
MHDVTAYLHFFFVPHRLVWSNWEKFITGGEDGQDTSVWPYLTIDYGETGVNDGSLLDYMGIPQGPAPGAHTTVREFSALPFASYQKVYNDYYRDQNLIEPINDQLVDGTNQSNAAGLTNIRRRAWQHDYFTSDSSFHTKRSRRYNTTSR